MGSYISILNNTQETYLVTVGSEEDACKIFSGILVPAMAASSELGSAGEKNATFSTTLSEDGLMLVEISGVSFAALQAFTRYASKLSGSSIPPTVSGWAQSTAFFLRQHLQNTGHQLILPGESRTLGKLVSSPSNQGICTRIRVNPNDGYTVMVDMVSIQPAFSRPTDDVIQVHDVQHWINKSGHRFETKFSLKADPPIVDRDTLPPLAPLPPFMDLDRSEKEAPYFSWFLYQYWPFSFRDGRNSIFLGCFNKNTGEYMNHWVIDGINNVAEIISEEEIILVDEAGTRVTVSQSLFP